MRPSLKTPPFVPYQSNRPLRPLNPSRLVSARLHGFGTVQSATNEKEAAETTTLVAAGVTAGSAIAAGAAAGSVVGPIGTAVGALAGLMTAVLSGAGKTTSAHIGSWDSQMVNSLSSIPSAAGVGRQFQWNYDSQGLVQMIEALLATGVYMSWDASLVSSYDVCAHWATTFATAVQAVCTAAATGKTGATLSVPITFSPGAGGVPVKNFSFKNPGIAIGPGAFSQSIIMGTSGLMYWMILGLGETTAHALANSANTAAQKVFALMADYTFFKVDPAASTPAVAAPAVAAVIPKAAAVVATTVPPKAVVTPPTPAVPVAPISVAAPPPPATVPTTSVSAPIIPASAQAAATCPGGSVMTTAIDENGNAVPVAVPVAAASGITTTDWLLLIGGGAVLYYLMRK